MATRIANGTKAVFNFINIFSCPSGLETGAGHAAAQQRGSFLKAENRDGMKTPARAPAQGAPRASAKKNQISQVQLRAKMGAMPAVNEGATDGEGDDAAMAGRTQSTVAGAGEKT